MQVYLFFVLLLAVFVAIFAVENTSPVDLKFLGWTFPQIPVVMVIICSFVVGALAAFFLGLTRMLRSAIRFREMEVLNRKLTEEIDQMKSKLDNNKCSAGSGSEE